MTFTIAILPIFIIILIGFLSVKYKLFSAKFIDELALLLFYIIVPVTLFIDIARLPITQVLHWPYLLAYLLTACIIIVLSILMSYVFFKRRLPDLIINAMTASITNSVYLAIPVFLLLFNALTPVAGAVLVQMIFNFLILFSLEYLTNPQSKSPWQLAFSTLIKTPLIIGVLLGLVVALNHISLPHIIQKTSQLIQQSVAFLALFALGGSLGSAKKGLTPKSHLEVSALVFIKNILHPLTAFAIGKFCFQLHGFWLMSLVLMAAMPSAKNCFVFATRYKIGQNRANRIVIITTVVSVILINIALLIAPKRDFEYQPMCMKPMIYQSIYSTS